MSSCNSSISLLHFQDVSLSVVLTSPHRLIMGFFRHFHSIKIHSMTQLFTREQKILFGEWQDERSTFLFLGPCRHSLFHMYTLEWMETVSAYSQSTGLFIKMGTNWIKSVLLRQLPGPRGHCQTWLSLVSPGASPSPLPMAQDAMSALQGCLSHAPATPQRGWSPPPQSPAQPWALQSQAHPCDHGPAWTSSPSPGRCPVPRPSAVSSAPSTVLLPGWGGGMGQAAKPCPTTPGRTSPVPVPGPQGAASPHWALTVTRH